MSQTQIQREVIEASLVGNYRLYREREEDARRFRLVKEYDLPNDNKLIHVIEIVHDNELQVKIIHVSTGWNQCIPVAMKLDSVSLQKVRECMMRVKSLQQFDELEHWLLTAKYITQQVCTTTTTIEGTKEPCF